MESRLAEIDGWFKELRQEFLKQANANNNYTKVADEIYALLEYDEQLVRRLVEKVTVYEEEQVVEFKSGLEIRVEI